MSDKNPNQASQDIVVSPRGALNIAVDVVAADVAYWAGINDELSPENKAFMMDYCTAVRNSVRRYAIDHEGEAPSREEIEIARLGDILVMTNTLAKENYFKNRQEIIDLSSSVIDSSYDPRAVVRVVHNPRRYLGVGHISPTQLSNALYVWGEVASNVTSLSGGSDARHIDNEVRAMTPSIGQVVKALEHIGVNLESLVDDRSVDLVSEMLVNRQLRISPQLISDPYDDVDREHYLISVPMFERPDGNALSFEAGYYPEGLPQQYDIDREQFVIDQADHAEYVRDHQAAQ